MRGTVHILIPTTSCESVNDANAQTHVYIPKVPFPQTRFLQHSDSDFPDNQKPQDLWKLETIGFVDAI